MTYVVLVRLFRHFYHESHTGKPKSNQKVFIRETILSVIQNKNAFKDKRIFKVARNWWLWLFPYGFELTKFSSLSFAAVTKFKKKTDSSTDSEDPSFADIQVCTVGWEAEFPWPCMTLNVHIWLTLIFNI